MVSFTSRCRSCMTGYPSWCKTEEDRARYVVDYEAHEGIVLDPDRIEKNPGMRMMAKLRLNSLWGKFGQNPIHTRTEYVEDPKRFYDLVFGDEQEVTNVLFVHGEVVQVQYDPKTEFLTDSPFMNVVLASFVDVVCSFEVVRIVVAIGQEGVVLRHRFGDLRDASRTRRVASRRLPGRIDVGAETGRLDLRIRIDGSEELCLSYRSGA